MEANIEKECSALGGLFQTIVTDLKASLVATISPICFTVSPEPVATTSISFQIPDPIQNDQNCLDSSTPVWEDFLSKATKLHSQLKTTALVAAVFLDSFQKVADMATNTRGNVAVSV
ncbi:MTSS1 [Branchiostoma lanceolatum]|uniref:MTSS1 protein n=1 Tax=Branchiostoma lanceolatum TaxID=7740 RepID=A0A8K0A4Q4_BRALA|nr:MTSS1 [Branchiostoma lanceolatum]